MKKIATILMLVAALLVGGMTADAKTTKSKSKSSQVSSKSFGPSTLIKKGMYCCEFQSNPGSKLVSAGFTKSGNTFTKSGITVKFNMSRPTVIDITFSSTAERDKFINATKSLGYQWSGLENTNGFEQGISISVSGNTVSLTMTA